MREIAVRPVLLAALAIGAVVAAVVASVLGVLRAAGVPAGGERLPAQVNAQRDAPGLASAPQDQLRRDRREKERQLATLGWIDRQRGIAHIPIGAAIDLLAARAAAPAAAPGAPAAPEGTPR